MSPATLLLLAFAFHGNAGNAGIPASDVSHWSAKALRGDLPTTGRAARMPARTADLMRIGGELDLDGWLGDGVLLLCDGGEKDSRELLAQAVRAREAVGRCSPAFPMPTRDAPLVVFHLRRAAFYRGVLDRLGPLLPDQGELLGAARGGAGFEMAEPLLCVISADGAPSSVRQNLLVHLVAHACFDAGFGTAPEWLREGFALDVEAKVCGEPEAFCRRGPHELPKPAAKGDSTWTRRLAAEWAAADDALFDDIFALAADGYREATAWRALALVRWLRERHAAKLAGIVSAGSTLDLALGPKWRAEFLADLRGRKAGG